MIANDRKSTLTQFGLKCREARAKHSRSIADQAIAMDVLPSEISQIEMGESLPSMSYVQKFGQWMGFDALEISKFRVFARPVNNVVQFRPNKIHQESRKLFRRVNQLSPEEIRNLRPRP